MPKQTTTDKVTRKIRDMEKRGDANTYLAFIHGCNANNIDLKPWTKRLATLRRKLGLPN
jgi:hypothetical protein